MAVISLAYQAIKPPPSKICGSPNGPPVTSSRVKLKDGRHLAYTESGIPKEKAKHKIIFIHGFDSCKYDMFPLSQEVVRELGVYVLSFDRAGYGESDPNPKQSEKSTALDIEELADQLELGSRFYVIGYSIGGEIIWACLKHIPHRLMGAAMVAPFSNYWWPGLPANSSREAYDQQLLQDKWAVRVAHHAPWLVYWWNTQKWFPASSVVGRRSDVLSTQDKELLPKLESRDRYLAQVRQQGEFESVHRDMIVGFGNWEFDPSDLENPFPNEGSLHLWQGAKDMIVPATLARCISQKLPWVRYHELPDAGHMFPFAVGMGDAIVKTLMFGDQ
ncbi:hypothetical protein COCNU_scaffold005186G000010 [Cocos nucifera]|nr:hypothetical protein [Cocos nucifera]